MDAIAARSPRCVRHTRNRRTQSSRHNTRATSAVTSWFDEKREMAPVLWSTRMLDSSFSMEALSVSYRSTSEDCGRLPERGQRHVEVVVLRSSSFLVSPSLLARLKNTEPTPSPQAYNVLSRRRWRAHARLQDAPLPGGQHSRFS